MSLQPLPPSKVEYIVKNVLAACEDINKLTKAGYEFLMLSSGFIAHYNRFGFMDHYKTPGALKQDILRNAVMNRWSNFRPGDQNYAYYHQKGDIYRRIVDALNNDPRKKFRVGWSKTYYISGKIEVVAETEAEAVEKVQNMIGSLGGSLQYDPDQDFVEVLI